MVRTVSIAVAATLLLVGCSGSDAAEPTVTTVVLTTTAAPVESTTTTAPATTTTEPAPTTTEVDEDALVAEVEAAYFAGFEAYHRAIFDPANEELRAALSETRTGDSLENILGILDDLVELNAVARENPDFGRARTEITGPVRFENEQRTEATLLVCQLNAEWFVEPAAGPNGEDSILRTDVIRSDVVVRLVVEDNAWKIAGGGNSRDLIGVETCDEV